MSGIALVELRVLSCYVKWGISGQMEQSVSYNALKSDTSTSSAHKRICYKQFNYIETVKITPVTHITGKLPSNRAATG
jgi:hypothetical protein